jgi:hypothetical protein
MQGRIIHPRRRKETIISGIAAHSGVVKRHLCGVGCNGDGRGKSNLLPARGCLISNAVSFVLVAQPPPQGGTGWGVVLRSGFTVS